jgi:CMP-N-acetylneuraminic acid synthetase
VIVKKTLCLIPARGGSKRIPRKNLAPLAGKPLLTHTVEVAMQAKIFDDVVVSSDDQEILNLARSLGAVPDHRPKTLSGDLVRFVEVIEEYLLRPGTREQYQYIASMLPTCPCRIVDDVRNAFELFMQHSGDVFLVAVREYEFPPQLALDLGKDGTTLSIRDPAVYRRTTRSQSLRKAYHPNGAIYIATIDGFLRERTFFAEPLLGYVMPPSRSLDIDYPHQFRIADFMMRKMKRQAEGNL